MLTYPQWIRTKNGGAGILRSRYELSKMYESLTSSQKEEKTFDEWIDSSSRNPLIVGNNGILSKHNVKHSDISLSKQKEEGIKNDKIDSNQKVLNPNSETGIFVVETEVVERDGGRTKFWTKVDRDNDNTFEKL